MKGGSCYHEGVCAGGAWERISNLILWVSTPDEEGAKWGLTLSGRDDGVVNLTGTIMAYGWFPHRAYVKTQSSLGL